MPLVKFYLSALIILLTNTIVKGQCYAPFIPLDCYGGIELNLDSTFRLTNERHISQWGWDNFNESYYEKNLKIINSREYITALDSIFQEAKLWVIDKIGKENYCQRIEYLYDRFRIFNKGYKQKGIRGEFYLKFHYQPITCWTGRGVNLKFKFQELENGKFHLEFPTNFPKCSKEDCDFYIYNLEELGRKAIDLGLIDGTEKLRDEKYNSHTIALEKNDIPFQKQSFLFDRKSGKYLKDTIQTDYNKRKISLEKLVNQSEVVVDATCIRTEEFRGSNGHLYTNHFFQPHHTLKGPKDPKIFAIATLGGKGESWSHSTYLPSPNTRSLLFLKRLNSDFLKVFENKIDIESCAQWGISCSPYILSNAGNAKIYTKVFPLISEISQSKFYNYKNINATSEETLKWLAENGKKILPKNNGLEIWMYNFSWNKQLNRVNGNIIARSTKDFAYLLEKDFVFEYDTMYVRSFGVKNKLISVSRFKGNPSGRNDFLPTATLTDNYELVCEDLGPNSFKVTIKAKGKDNLAQLYPMGFNNTFFSNVLLNLNFEIKDIIVKGSFELKLKAEPFERVGKYYEPLIQKKKKFAFQKIETPIIKADIKKSYPIIENVFPKDFTVADTITILGENLDAFVEDVYCPCSTKDRGIEFRRHCLVPQENIIFSSYKKLKFIVPESFEFNKDELKMLFPDSGTIKVRYEPSETPITFSKDH